MLQAQDIKISFHENCKWAGGERFHIRVRVENKAVAAFTSIVEEFARYGDLEDLEDTWFYLNGARFTIRDPMWVAEEDGYAYFAVESGSIRADFTPYQGGWNIDFSIHKDFGAWENLDYTRWTREDTGVPPLFWVEPAAILRAILGKGGH